MIGTQSAVCEPPAWVSALDAVVRQEEIIMKSFVAGPSISLTTQIQPVAMNRMFVILGAVIIQLCLGVIYAWSIFTPHLIAAPFNFTSTQTQVIFSVGLATFAITTVVAGRWMTRIGPVILTRTGGLVLALGYLMATFMGTSFPGMLICIGLIGGAGIGLAYVVPIAVGVKWFPDKKGLVTGLAVAGFGFGALIWIKLAGSWGGLIERWGVLNVFFIYGVAFWFLVTLGSLWMKNPPQGWKPPGFSPAESNASAAAPLTIEMDSREMLRTPQFYMLWTMFVFGAMAGLMVIGIIQLFGIEALQARAGMSATQAAATAGTAMAVFYAISNGIGRIVWGIFSDRIGRRRAMVLMFLSQAIMMAMFYYMGGVPALLFLGAAVIGFNFGGNFALFPAATADYFGSRTVGLNYGWIFTAYGVGGILGPVMAGMFRDFGAEHALSAWLPAFLIGAAACFIAAILAALLPCGPLRRVC